MKNEKKQGTGSSGHSSYFIGLGKKLSCRRERTALAEFRTGLALTFIGPTVSTIIAYVLSVFTVDQTIVLDVINLTFFSILTILGCLDNFSFTIQINNNQKEEKTINKHIIKINKSSKNVYDLLFDYLEDDE
jgi:uncharacterized membrane protein YidH (DUF202 family)